tara:strand:- start:213 stop:335 length:123 start_codon:yes stop_codon:yes gene_type:complete
MDSKRGPAQLAGPFAIDGLPKTSLLAFNLKTLSALVAAMI